MLKKKKWIGVPCPSGCVSNMRYPFFISPFNSLPTGEVPTREYKIGQDTPDE